MELLKNREFKGLFFDIIQESLGTSYFTIIIRATNLNDKKKKVGLTAHYISIENGLLDTYGSIDPLGNDGRYLQPNSFVDAKIDFKELRQTHDGDRMELFINNGNIASLLLLRQGNQWYIDEEKNSGSINRDIKKLIEHFDGIDEKFGLTLQNFSVKVEDEFSLKLFCEVLALNGEVPEEGFSIEVAIYDTDNNIVYHDSISKYDDEFKGFEVFAFNSIKLDIPVDEIGKIRFYPTR